MVKHAGSDEYGDDTDQGDGGADGENPVHETCEESEGKPDNEVSGEVTPDNRTPNLEDELLAWTLGGALVKTASPNPRSSPIVPKTLFEGPESPQSLDEGEAKQRIEFLEHLF